MKKLLLGFLLISLIVVFVFWKTYGFAHEMTPAYVKFKASYVENVQVGKLNIFNRRTDVRFYGIEVLNEKLKPVPFASTTKFMEVKTNTSKTFEVYIRNKDLKNRAYYVCTISKVMKKIDAPVVASRICSRIK